MADWLSFWNKETRAENEPRLTGKEVGRIYIPYGAGRVAVGDRIYCVGIAGGELLLITRIDATSVKPDDNPKYIDSVLVDGAENGIVAAYDRTVPDRDLKAIRYLRANSTKPEPVKVTRTGDVVFSAFQGRSSIRELVQGASNLDVLLKPTLGIVSPVLISVYGLLGLQFPNLAQLDEIPNLAQVVLHLGTEISEPRGPIVPMPGSNEPKTKPGPPSKGDKTFVMFTDTEHILSGIAQEAAFSLARDIAVDDRSLGVLIQTAPSVQLETFKVVSALGREAGATEVSLYVRHLK
jgi:hypothetical protein